MLRPAGERSALADVLLVSAMVSVLAISKNSVRIRFMMLLDSVERESWPPVSSNDHEGLLLDGANAAGLSGAACLPGADVMAVTPVVGWYNIGERSAVAFRIELHAVTDRGTELRWIHQDTGHGARGDVHCVIDGPASVGVASQIAGQEAEPLLAAHRRRSNSGIQPQQISHRARIARTAARTNRRDILAENQQVSPRIRGHRNADGAEDSRQHRIQEEVSKLRVVLRFIHAEAILGTGTDDEFIDE